MSEPASDLRLRGRPFLREVPAPTERTVVSEPDPRKQEERPVNGKTVLLDGLSKSFASRRVLSRLNLEIPAGQLLAIVGRSGCGKSTLLRLIAGLDRPSSGMISVGGAEVKSLQSNVRLLFQDARLLPWHRVISNVGIARTKNWRDSAAAALADVGLADRANDWPAVLSGARPSALPLRAPW